MKSRATLLSLVLMFTGAAAQTTVTLPGTIPSSVTQKIMPELQAFLAAGGTVTLLDAAGATIGTLNANGTVTLIAGKTLADVKSVRVTPNQGSAQTFTLARGLDQPGAIKFQVTQPNGKTVALPLPALVNRMTPNVKEPETDDQDRKNKQDNSGKSQKPETKGNNGNSKK